MDNERIIELVKELMSEMEKAGLYKFDDDVSSINIYEMKLDSGNHIVKLDSCYENKLNFDIINFDVTE